VRIRPPRLTFIATLAAVCLWQEVQGQTTPSGGLTGIVTDQSKALSCRGISSPL